MKKEGIVEMKDDPSMTNENCSRYRPQKKPRKSGNRGLDKVMLKWKKEN